MGEAKRRGLTQIGRLVMRVEGDSWCAYYALADTMTDALPLGQIRMAIAQIPDRKEAFMTLMRDAVADIIEESTGKRPEWNGPERAPEHERAGRG